MHGSPVSTGVMAHLGLTIKLHDLRDLRDSLFDTGARATLILMVLEALRPVYNQQNMDETLRQLGGLLLGSIPTVICFLLLYGLYSLLVHQPLTRVLGERHARTLGAIEKAGADIAEAEARSAEYQRRLREARVSLFKSQEARRAQAAQARAAALADARKQAEAQLEQARASIERDKVAAKRSLEAEAERLASEIIRSIFEPALAQAPVGGR